jgi:ubiquinol-cytochrome c reductase cytochrome b subunit
MLPSGEFIEVHEELSPEQKFTLTQHEQPTALEVPKVDANGVLNPQGLKGKLRARFSQAHVEQIPAPTETEAKALEGGHH